MSYNRKWVFSSWPYTTACLRKNGPHVFVNKSKTDDPDVAIFDAIDHSPMHDVSTKAQLSRLICKDFMAISNYQPILAVQRTNGSKYLNCMSMSDVLLMPEKAAMIGAHITSTTVWKSNQAVQE